MRIALRWLAVSSITLALLTAAVARTRPRYGGTVRVETRNAAFDDSTPGYSLVAETLTEIDADKAVPKLAVRWESQSGDRRWQFWLRSGVKWHDGSSLDAGDVAKAFNGRNGAPWRSVRAVGDILVFESDSPMPRLAEQLAIPRYAVARADANGAMIGTGPLKMTRWMPGGVALGAFDDYWGGRTFVDSMEVMTGRGLREQWMDVAVGRADLVEVPAEVLRRAQQEHLKSRSAANAELIALSFDANSPRVRDERVRQVVAATIDRGALLNFIFQKQGSTTAALLPEWMTGYATVFPTEQRLVLARELRGQTGQVAALTVGYPSTDAALQLVAERIALNAREVGLTVQAQPISSGSRPDMVVARVNLPSTVPAVALYELAARFGVDPPVVQDDGIETLYRAERDVLGSARVVPLLYVSVSYAMRDRLRQVQLSPEGAAVLDDAFVEDRK